MVAQSYREELRLRRLIAVILTACAFAAGCSSGGSNDPLQVTDQLVAAGPAAAPPPASPPAGRVVELNANANLIVHEPSTAGFAVAVGNPAELRLYRVENLTAPPRTVPLPAPASDLRAEGGRVIVAMPEANAVAMVDPRTGAVDQQQVQGAPTSAAHVRGQLLVTLRDGKNIVVRDGNRQHTISGFEGPAQLRQTGKNVVVLDRLRSAVTLIDPRQTDAGEALRSGEGATNAVADRFGRILVTDTRGGELIAFSTDPLLMRQRFPVPGAPYGLAYDPQRDLAWVTLTERNEVVGYDVAGGEPVERYRFPTVRQPNSVAVHPKTGLLVVASAAGEGMQVIQP